MFACDSDVGFHFECFMIYHLSKYSNFECLGTFEYTIIICFIFVIIWLYGCILFSFLSLFLILFVRAFLNVCWHFVPTAQNVHKLQANIALNFHWWLCFYWNLHKFNQNHCVIHFGFSLSSARCMYLHIVTCYNILTSI